MIGGSNIFNVKMNLFLGYVLERKLQEVIWFVLSAYRETLAKFFLFLNVALMSLSEMSWVVTLVVGFSFHLIDTVTRPCGDI